MVTSRNQGRDKVNSNQIPPAVKLQKSSKILMKLVNLANGHHSGHKHVLDNHHMPGSELKTGYGFTIFKMQFLYSMNKARNLVS